MDVDPILSPLVAAGTDGERKKRDARQAERRPSVEESEAAAEEREPVSHAEPATSRAPVEEEEGSQSAAGSAFNPENPYHVSANFTHDVVYDKQDSGVGAWRHLGPEGTLKVTLQTSSLRCQPC